MCDLTKSTARDIIQALRDEKVSPLELLDALEKRVNDVDGAVNALPMLCFDRARKQAAHLMSLPVAERGILCGLPLPIKDLDDVAGVKTSYGSMPFADNIATKSCFMVEKLEAEGAIVFAKSNTPEFGAGGNTFNDVFGSTRNPWNLSKTAGGSSGGAAAALASGTAWLAIAYAITLVSVPAISVPCGFTYSGLPVGLQMVGQARGEADLLASALLMQNALNLNLTPALLHSRADKFILDKAS